jgi:hypothetical protein
MGRKQDNRREGTNIEKRAILGEPRHRPDLMEWRREAEGYQYTLGAGDEFEVHRRDICAQHASQAQP